ncbi:NUDIX domain-containing protein [Clostridium tertium]|uniref:Bifunctional NMN adenylyltransferase/Nudix hydrolase n=1 Tax=Clostridium tertium TaxID=1559 RepID=A0A6N2Y9Q5_9CLOT
MKGRLLKNKEGLTEEEFLKQYSSDIYKKPSLTVDILIFTVMEEENNNYRKLAEKSLKILLVKRGSHPYIGDWALPGGFVSIDEGLDEAALRVLRNETNIENIYMEQLYTFGEVNRDPRTRVISSSYMALVDSSSLSIKAGHNEEDACWFDVDYKLLEENDLALENGDSFEEIVEIKLWNNIEELYAKVRIVENLDGRVRREIIESTGLAFDHGKIIEYAISRLRNKIEYTSLAFNLMPELFTLTELQKVYEIIQGKELLAAAFRRKISNMVIETDKFTKDVGHRPSKLFKYNTSWKRNR